MHRILRMKPVRILSFFLVWALVVLLCLSWHLHNSLIPIWDGAAYVLNAQEILYGFESGILFGLKNAYLTRGWRPIAFPLFASPFFLISSKNLNLSIALVQTFTLGFLVSMCLTIFRKFLSPVNALLGALCILGLPWVLDYSYLFYSELMWLALFSVAIFFCIKCHENKTWSNLISLGIAVGITSTIRPVETILVLLLPTFLVLFIEYKSREIKLANYIVFLAQFALTIFLAYFVATLSLNPLLTFLPVICAIPCVLAQKKKTFIVSVYVAQIIFLIWFAPFLKHLFLWVFSTSFGDLVELEDTSLRYRNLALIFYRLSDKYQHIPLITLAITATPFFWALKKPLNFRQGMVLSLLGCSLMSLLPILTAHSLSGAMDSRRIMLGMFLLYLGLIGASLFAKGRFFKLRCSIVVLLVISQLLFAVLNVFDPEFFRSSHYFYFTNPLYRKASNKPDPNILLLNELQLLEIESGSISAYTYCYRDYAGCESQNLPAYEPEALTALARSFGRRGLYVNMARDLDFERPSTLSQQIKARGYKFILLDTAPPTKNINFYDPYNIHIQALNAMYANGTLVGFDRIGCFWLNREICLLRVR